MLGLIYQATKRFFLVMTLPLNKDEQDQPPPLEIQKADLLKRMAELDVKIKEHEELKKRIKSF